MSESESERAGNMLKHETFFIAVNEEVKEQTAERRVLLQSDGFSHLTMKLLSVVFICCVSALHDEKHKAIFVKTVGEDFRLSFGFNQSGSSIKRLCRNGCANDDDVLIAADGDGAKSSRYEVQYDDRERRVQLVIRELKENDTGRYRYEEVGSSSPTSKQDFEIRVRERCAGGVTFGELRVYSGTEGGTVTVRCSLNATQLNKKLLYKTEPSETLIEASSSRAASGRFSIQHGSDGLFNVTVTGLKRSDSGRYWCGVGGPSAEDKCQEFEIRVSGRYVLRRSVCLMVVVLFLLSLLVVYDCKTKRSYLNSEET